MVAFQSPISLVSFGAFPVSWSNLANNKRWRLLSLTCSSCLITFWYWAPSKTVHRAIFELLCKQHPLSRSGSYDKGNWAVNDHSPPPLCINCSHFTRLEWPFFNRRVRWESGRVCRDRCPPWCWSVKMFGKALCVPASGYLLFKCSEKHGKTTNSSWVQRKKNQSIAWWESSTLG